MRHCDAQWFQLRPDMVISRQGIDVLVLDTKWKLLDAGQDTSAGKYRLNQGDFYQLHAYGRSYLSGRGVVALVYPCTDQFDRPLPVFDFPGSEGLQLWVLPFCRITCNSVYLHLVSRFTRAVRSPADPGQMKAQFVGAARKIRIR